MAPPAPTASPSHTYVEMLKPQVPMTSFASIPMVSPTNLNGSLTFIFSEKKMVVAEKPVKNTLVMKFPCGRPSLDNIKINMVKRWGLASFSMIGIFDNQHIMLMMKSEYDFAKAWARETRTGGLHISGFQVVSRFQWKRKTSSGSNLGKHKIVLGGGNCDEVAKTRKNLGSLTLLVVALTSLLMKHDLYTT